MPDHLTAGRRRLLVELAERNDAAHGDDLLGLVLSGSAGRGLATARSDLDVHVVLTDDAAGGRSATRAADVDELPVSLGALEAAPPFGTPDWWFRWSFAWAPTLLDRTGGRLPVALQRQATLTPGEADDILVGHSRLDGWVDHAYRALKSDRDGRPLERRLDTAESVPWLLDVVFTFAGRVRPYQKYLPGELREHPLADWPADLLLPLVTRLLDGDPTAVREVFARLETALDLRDATGSGTPLRPVVDDWGTDLDLLRR